jgi:hypothetical protein
LYIYRIRDINTTIVLVVQKVQVQVRIIEATICN